jgi:hypothetical protein
MIEYYIVGIVQYLDMYHRQMVVSLWYEYGVVVHHHMF